MLSRLSRTARRWLNRNRAAENSENTAAPADSEATAIVLALAQLRQTMATRPANEYLFLDYCRQNAHLSKAQIFQDLFVLFETKEKRSGFFVEFGAGNGVDLSNTHLLEKQFGWSGVLAEPAESWLSSLRKERICAIDDRCVWNKSRDRVEFNEVDQPEYSTIAKYSSGDRHSEKRKRGRNYLVETVTLTDLLAEHNAPDCIDYLSIDTEGSELEILKAFNFQRYDVRLITVEHNYRNERDDIHRLLKLNGFVRKFEVASLMDDWYVKTEPIGAT
jgi:FkbM family methyltransferase